MHRKALIIYHSVSGNTKKTAEMIALNVEKGGYQATLSNVKDIKDSHDFSEYDLIFIGVYTWGDGDMPPKMRKYLKEIITHGNVNSAPFAVFGTGDTQWTYYCRAVDEMEYHLSKHTKVIGKLKIEQLPINEKQTLMIEKFVEKTLKHIEEK